MCHYSLAVDWNEDCIPVPFPVHIEGNHVFRTICILLFKTSHLVKAECTIALILDHFCGPSFFLLMIKLWRNRGDLAEKIATVLSGIAFVSLKSLKNEAAEVLSHCSIAPKKNCRGMRVSFFWYYYHKMAGKTNKQKNRTWKQRL